MNGHRLFVTALSSLLLLGSCTNSTPASSADNSAGASKFKAACNSCHNTTGAVAPPAFAVQKHYKKAFASKEEFIKAISNFVSNPNAENALLQPAIEKFGLMPKMQFEKEDLAQIAAYLFDGEFEKPNKHKHAFNDTATTAFEKGQEIAQTTKQLLGKNLMEKLKSEGTLGALTFCNLKAIALTDSMVSHYETFIQRVSDKPRNPNNKANNSENELIAEYAARLKAGENAMPKLIDENGVTYFYAPIVTNQMCLQCHGELNKTLQSETYAAITKLYPNDAAIGYAENQVRGLFKVEIK